MRTSRFSHLVKLLILAGLASIIWMLVINEGSPIYTDVLTSGTANEDAVLAFEESMPFERHVDLNEILPTTPSPVVSSLIRTFRAVQDEMLYIYQKYLLANWTHSLVNLQRLRNEIFLSSNATTADQFILTQKNTRSGVPIPFYGRQKSADYKPQNDIILRHLPKEPIFPSGTVFDKCSVVGNGGLLLRSGCGKEIDSANYVFRCNLVPIQEHGEDAGFKTNMTTMNPSIVATRYNGLRGKRDVTRFLSALQEYTGNLYLPCINHQNALNMCKAKILPVIYHGKNQRANVTIGNPLHLMGIMQLWKSFGIHYMSTGFYLAQTALTMCDEVHLYGFWPFNRSSYPSARTFNYHFFDSMAQTKAHKFSAEFQILWQQHMLGIVRLHTQDCEDQ